MLCCIPFECCVFHSCVQFHQHFLQFHLSCIVTQTKSSFLCCTQNAYSTVKMIKEDGLGWGDSNKEYMPVLCIILHSMQQVVSTHSLLKLAFVSSTTSGGSKITGLVEVLCFNWRLQCSRDQFSISFLTIQLILPRMWWVPMHMDIRFRTKSCGKLHSACKHRSDIGSDPRCWTPAQCFCFQN